MTRLLVTIQVIVFLALDVAEGAPPPDLLKNNIQKVLLNRHDRHKIKALIQAPILNLIRHECRTGNHQGLSELGLGFRLLRDGAKTLTHLHMLLLHHPLLIKFVIYLIDVLAGLVAIHDGHVEVGDDGVEEGGLFGECAPDGVLEVDGEISQVLLHLNHCLLPILRRDHLHVLPALNQLSYHQQLKGLVVDDQELHFTITVIIYGAPRNNGRAI